MNKIALAASSAAVLLMAGGAANADAYLKFGAGPTWTPALTGEIDTPFGDFGGKQNTGTGYNGEVGLGSDLGFWDMPDWSVEMDAIYTHNTFAHVTECSDFGFVSEGIFHSFVPFCDFEISKLALEFDVLYHIPLGSEFSPYVGGGVEARDTIFHNGTEIQDPALANFLIIPAGDFQHWNVAGHAVVGVDWNMDATWAPFIEYRYEIRSSDKVTNAILGNFTHVEYQSHNLIVGIKLHLGN